MIPNWQTFYHQNKNRPLNKIMQDYNKLVQLINEQRLQALLLENQSVSSVGGGGITQNSNPVGGSGTIVFNGKNPNTIGSFVAARNAQISSWFPTNGSWTIEWFQKMDLANCGSFPRVWSVGKDTSAVLGVSIEGGSMYLWPNGISGTLPTYNGVWLHIAMVYDATVSSGTFRTYAGGSSIATQASLNLNLAVSNKDLYIGSDGLTSTDGYAGNITNFRWTNSAVYDVTKTSLTLPTAPLTQLAQTKLLLLGGSTANPVVDATGINTLEYRNLVWSADSPF